MRLLIYLLFTSVFLLDFLSRQGLLIRQLTWLPELLSIIVAVGVILIVARQKTVNIGLAYWVIFLLLGVHIFLGVVLNAVPTGAVFQGIRTYFKHIAFFFLPAVCIFSGTDIRKQLILLLGLTVLQFPIAMYQRFVVSANRATGDFVTGTLTTSSFLSIYLMCVFTMLLAFLLKRKISMLMFMCLAVLLLFPTTVNETKGTVILAPFALLVPVLFMDGGRERRLGLIATIVIGAVFLGTFVSVYDSIRTTHGKGGLIEFYTKEGVLSQELVPHSFGINPKIAPGRVDILINAWNELSRDPMHILSGLGMGNVSTSFLGEKFSGNYAKKYYEQTYTASAQLLWEIGVLGIALVLMLLFKIFRDAIFVSKRQDIHGVIALGWIGIVSVLVVSLSYKNIIRSDVIAYLFWYFSGYVAATRFRMEYDVQGSY